MSKQGNARFAFIKRVRHIAARFVLHDRRTNLDAGDTGAIVPVSWRAAMDLLNMRKDSKIFWPANAQLLYTLQMLSWFGMRTSH